MPHLFDPLTIKGVTFRNRIGVSPMCMYCYTNGIVDQFQEIHLGARSLGGAGLVIAEATAVEAIGRITPYDAGIWEDGQIVGQTKTVEAIKLGGAIPGIQIAHAGRKASTKRPSDGSGLLTPEDSLGWQTIAPSSIPFSNNYSVPEEMSVSDINRVQDSFVKAAVRAKQAGYQFLEIHAAHGYLLHSFYSPISNKRQDQYGGSFEKRIRFLLETTEKIRLVWPTELPLCVRISGTDWIDGGWNVDDSVALVCRLKDLGVDIIDCSSGGGVANANVPVGPGYQVHISREVKERSKLMTAAVGLITESTQANKIIEDGSADIVLLGREFLRNATWPIRAAKELGVSAPIPFQYARGY